MAEGVPLGWGAGGDGGGGGGRKDRWGEGGGGGGEPVSRTLCSPSEPRDHGETASRCATAAAGWCRSLVGRGAVATATGRSSKPSRVNTNTGGGCAGGGDARGIGGGDLLAELASRLRVAWPGIKSSSLARLMRYTLMLPSLAKLVALLRGLVSLVPDGCLCGVAAAAAAVPPDGCRGGLVARWRRPRGCRLPPPPPPPFELFAARGVSPSPPMTSIQLLRHLCFRSARLSCRCGCGLRDDAALEAPRCLRRPVLELLPGGPGRFRWALPAEAALAGVWVWVRG